MKFCRRLSTNQLSSIGAACTAIGVNQPTLLPLGLALMAVAAVQQWRACQRR